MAKGKKTGGRQKGTPNKENPLKNYLRAHSEKYFQPNPANPQGRSDFDNDIDALTPDDRVTAEIKLLEFHTPRIKAVEVDLEAQIAVQTIEDRLRLLCNEGDD